MKAARTRALNKKHAGTGKHGHTAKHTGTAQRHAAKAHKQVAHRAVQHSKAAHLRAWSPDEDFPMCSARAVAESLRLTLGVPVRDGAVVDLYRLAAVDVEAGASILAALRVAQAYPDRLGHDVMLQFAPELLVGADVLSHKPIILGLDLPWGEPHAVVAHDGAWWSWGEPWSPADFPGAVIEEAWAVTW